MDNTQRIELKEKFKEHYKKICTLGDSDYNKFISTSLKFLKRAIRVNTLKTSIDDVKCRLQKNWSLEQVSWCSEGFWIEHNGIENEKRRDVGNLKEHMLGYFYIQEPASMIPPIILEPKPGELVLDMCASPGSKATQIAQYMNNKGILVANDFKFDRIQALTINMQRCGVLNSIITLMQGHWFAASGIMFDKILVDAPCSGTGTIRKSFKTLRIWNPNMVKRLAGTQRQLVESAFSVLKPGGTLVYSTCSLEPWENEAVISHLLNKQKSARIESIRLNINSSKPIMEFDGEKFNPEVNKCLRLWPQDNDTEGFFVAKICKAKL